MCRNQAPSRNLVGFFRIEIRIGCYPESISAKNAVKAESLFGKLESSNLKLPREVPTAKWIATDDRSTVNKFQQIQMTSIRLDSDRLSANHTVGSRVSW